MPTDAKPWYTFHMRESSSPAPVFTAFHVYRQDHSGRGVQRNHRPLSSKASAEVVMDRFRAWDRGRSRLNPNPGYWVVGVTASGQRLPVGR